MRLACVLAAGLVLLRPSPAEDWPQWRGPNRDGVVKSFSEPQAWPEKLKLKWKVQVGEGHSSPVVAGGMIFLHTRQGDREVISALRPDNGQIIWQQGYPAPYTMNPAATRHSKGVKSTPVVSDGKLYTLGISGTLSAWDSKTGKPLWRKESSAATFGTATSPVIDRGLLIVHLGGVGLAAFDAQSGAEKWSWKGDAPAYASPILVELGGTRQVVTQSERNIVSVAESNGQLLWKIPFTTPYEQNIVTPVVYGQNLILAGLNAPTMSIRAMKRGDEWVTEKLWENKDVSMYMSSPVLSGDFVFGFSHRNKGQFFCVDARSGATQWTTPGREGDNAAIVSAGHELLLLKDNAELIIAKKNSKAFEAVRRYTVADSLTWAHPVVFENGILIKDASTLALWGLE